MGSLALCCAVCAAKGKRGEDGPVPESGEAEGGGAHQGKRDPHHHAGEDAQLHHLRHRLATGIPTRFASSTTVLTVVSFNVTAQFELST